MLHQAANRAGERNSMSFPQIVLVVLIRKAVFGVNLTFCT